MIGYFSLLICAYSYIPISITRKYPLRRYILGVLTHTTAWDWLCGDDIFLRLYICSSASPCMAEVWLAFWNSDYVVSKSTIHTSATSRRQQSDLGLRMIQNAYFLLLTHANKLLFVTFCGMTAGIGPRFWTHVHREPDMEIKIVITISQIDFLTHFIKKNNHYAWQQRPSSRFGRPPIVNQPGRKRTNWKCMDF